MGIILSFLGYKTAIEFRKTGKRLFGIIVILTGLLMILWALNIIEVLGL